MLAGSLTSAALSSVATCWANLSMATGVKLTLSKFSFRNCSCTWPEGNNVSLVVSCMCLCMHPCVCARAHVCMCMPVYVHACVCVCVCACLCVCTCEHECECMHVCVYGQ